MAPLSFQHFCTKGYRPSVTSTRHSTQGNSHCRFHRFGYWPSSGQLATGRLAPRTASADAAVGGASSDAEPPQNFEVFPRIKERDPYRKLGVTREADFEEIQSARNFLMEQYRWHEPSRESIELSFERILNERMQWRHKHGFRPPSTGRKTDMQSDPEKVTLLGAIKGAFEPSVPLATVVNEGVIFLGLAIWAAVQSAAADPILPIGGAFGYCAYKLFEKRNRRNPDGPYFGNSPLWGALGYSLLGMLFGVAFGLLVSRFVPFPAFIKPESVAVGLIPAMNGFVALYLK